MPNPHTRQQRAWYLSPNGDNVELPKRGKWSTKRPAWLTSIAMHSLLVLALTQLGHAPNGPEAHSTPRTFQVEIIQHLPQNLAQNLAQDRAATQLDTAPPPPPRPTSGPPERRSPTPQAQSPKSPKSPKPPGAPPKPKPDQTQAITPPVTPPLTPTAPPILTVKHPTAPPRPRPARPESVPAPTPTAPHSAPESHNAPEPPPTPANAEDAPVATRTAEISQTAICVPQATQPTVRIDPTIAALQHAVATAVEPCWQAERPPQRTQSTQNTPTITVHTAIDRHGQLQQGPTPHQRHRPSEHTAAAIRAVQRCQPYTQAGQQLAQSRLHNPSLAIHLHPAGHASASETTQPNDPSCQPGQENLQDVAGWLFQG